MTNAELVAEFQFVILASSLIRHSTFVLQHFTIRVHLACHSFGESEFVVKK
jgi:hypothetical protein